MTQRSFQDILDEKLHAPRTEAPPPQPMSPELDPSGLSFLLGQIGKFHFSPPSRYQKPKTKKRARRNPSHLLNDLEKTAFDYFLLSNFPLPEDFTFSELKHSFRRLALTLHPDRGGSAHGFIELKQHLETLSKVFRKQV